jgi:phosphoribosylglycinamide formyltransferase-1
LVEEDRILIAVFASGNGSNAENLIRYSREDEISDKVKIKALICDNADAAILDKVKDLDVLSALVPFKGDKKLHEKAILDVLDALNIKWVLLAGYMRVLSEEFIDHFYDEELGQSRIINIHPSLLPDFKGKDAYKQAFNSNVEKSGVTVHFVDSGVDTGKIILQEQFNRLEEDDFESFKKRGMEQEYIAYRKVLKKLANNNLS